MFHIDNIGEEKMVGSCKEHTAFTDEVFLVNVVNDQAPVSILCRWRLCQTTEVTKSHFRAADLLLYLLPRSYEDDCDKNTPLGSTASTTMDFFVRQLVQHNFDGRNWFALKLILVPSAGYLLRSDILDIRMQNSEFVEEVVSLCPWGQQIPALSSPDPNSLLAILPSSAGALLVKQRQSSTENSLLLLQKDLEMRLSFDWTLTTKPVSRKVGVVGGRSMCDETKEMYGSQGFFDAARALGISIVVFDKPGHWLEKEKYAHLRDEFIPMDMSDLTQLPKRIAFALKERSVDGVVTFTDDFVIATAEAAEILGLPTEPSKAMKLAHYKHEMRSLVNNTNIQAIHLDNAGQMDSGTTNDILKGMQYPLIVKPSRGLLSRGVKKVTEDESMRRAVRMLEQDGLTEQGILIETYVDGPELDANFVLLDGEVLFLEVTDNMPCLGDASGATLADNFTETVQISSSGLPSQEIAIIRTSLQESLLLLGFRSGVFHVEARMQNSSMQYQDEKSDGVVDLAPRSTNGHMAQQPDVFLIEVNAREPGTAGTWATLYTYGVDLGALQLLRALEDRERFKALSIPFGFLDQMPGGGGGAQYWTAHCIIPVHRDNIYVPVDFFERVYEALPEIIPWVSRAELYAESGTVVSPSGGTGWMAYFLLYSRTSREHVLRMYHLAAEVSKLVLDGVSPSS